MLHLHHADQLEPLLDALADVFAPPPDDPFTPDLVVVPAAGMEDAVTVGLGARVGITANVEFVFPGRFMARALGDPLADAADGDPWRLPQLTWWVLDELRNTSVAVPGLPTGDDGWWPLARRVADLFDRYATQRPRLVQQWAEGVDTDGTVTPDGSFAGLDAAHRWQPQLWRGLRQRIGVPSPPERLPLLLADIATGRVQPVLPPRVALFGLGGVAPAMLNVLTALGSGERRDVHVFLRHPSHVAWQHSDGGLGGALSLRANVDVTTHVHHPLLSSWGRPALEARKLLNGTAGMVEHPHGVHHAQPDHTLLHALQRAIRLDLPVVAQPSLSAADGSLQVHACHGVARQLETVRDVLGHAFVHDPTLQPHEVLVLCPDLDAVAPLVEAVFQRGTLPLPVRIGDRSLTTDDPIAAAVHTVLSLVSGRATLTEVLGLLQFEPVRRRFGWTIEHTEQLAQWAATMGTKWGLQAADRRAWQLPDQFAAGTWRSMVDQLLAGMAMSAPTPRLVLGDIAPFDAVRTDEYPLVGGLADLLEQLVDLHAALHGQRTVAQWMQLVHGVVDDFCAVEPDDAWRLQAVHRQLDDVVRAAGVEPVLLDVADLRALLGDALDERPGRLPLRSGAITVSSMTPQHGVPARVICIVGLDEGTLRGGTFDGDDVLGVHPCVGERHPRLESRQVLLDAVLAARDRLVITCNGADLATNKEVPFVVPLEELLGVVQTMVPDQPLVVRHPRHGFDEPTSFDPTMLHAAEARRAALDAARTVAPTVGSPWSLPPVDLVELDVDQLVAAVQNPSRVYLADRLQVRLPGERELPDDQIPLTIDGMSKARLGAALLAARRSDGDADDWQAVARLDGAVPPQALGEPILAAVRTDVHRIELAAQKVNASLSVTDRVVSCIVSVGGVDVPVSGVIGGVVESADGPMVTDVRYVRPKESQRLALGVRLAAAQLADPRRTWTAASVSRPKGTNLNPVAWTLSLRGDSADQRLAAAATFLTAVAELRAWALRDAVPFFDAASHSLFSGRTGHLNGDLRDDLRDPFHALLWPGLAAAEFQAHPDAIEVANRVWGAFTQSIEATSVTIRLKRDA